jgi:5-methylthioribose kinase
MLEIDQHNAWDYLRDRGWIDSRNQAAVELLAWGVSNVVLRVTPETGEPFVIKQSRSRLRTPDPWFSRLDRIWRETDVMQILQPLLPDGVVPRVLFDDRENYLFAMEAAPAAHDVWKQLLLEGAADVTIAARLGEFLSAIHGRTANLPHLATRFGDRQVFDELRVDPFYRRIVQQADDAAHHVEGLIAEMAATTICLVHADFSPKNVLVAGHRIVLVDFETAHYGDPAFDTGFFLSHLLLKAVLHADRFLDYTALTTEFWSTYLAGLAGLDRHREFAPSALVRRTLPHLAACMWARVDGTSKVDYLPLAKQDAVREFSRSVLISPPADWRSTLDRLAQVLDDRRLTLKD